MPVTEARVDTDRPSRYLIQFCKHAAAMGGRRAHRFRPHGGAASARGDVTVHAEWSERHGSVVLDPWGRVLLDADDTTLTVRVEAGADDDLHRIQQIISDDLDRFRRHRLVLDWRPVAATDPLQGNPG